MRIHALLAVVPSLAVAHGACGPAGDPEAATIEDLSLAPDRARFVEIDAVAGGGAAGYTGYRIAVVAAGHGRREVGLVHAHPYVGWDGAAVIVRGCFDDRDLATLRAARVGLELRAARACR